ncbi:hypothetical protein PVAND_010038 [Polypedilum vanderplanki]|uniref:SAM domain-containing protein n=1 Tax=Polypedilum vanderplanki TaxID=319348 RepID=A0A9J6CF17_POLVA|nr:hypothetical protein PVAND_010038 [Polypedilum vanderplanki]
MDLNDEASKLLEKALSQFDGIILDDQNSQPSTLNVLSAATTLTLALQQCKNTPSPPDKETAEIINAWLEAFMPPIQLTLGNEIEKEVVQKGDITPPKHSENARKIQRLLKKRREMLAEQKQKLEIEKQSSLPEKPQKVSNDTKIIHKNEQTTSEEEEEQPETLTENSESYDSNDSLHGVIINKDLGEKVESSTDDEEEDDEITWTCLQRSQKRTHESFDQKYDIMKEEEADRKTPARNELRSPNSMKPPRHSNVASASLDRRQRSRSQSHRRERDSKSRSTHSLKEKDLNDKILIANNLAKDNNSSSSCSNKRMSPIAWEIPPPPAFHPWDQHYHKHNMTSREELRSMDYYRRPYDPYRLGSCQELYHFPSTHSLSGNCDSPYYHYPPPSCCSSHYYPPSYQRQDNSSERVRRLQSDKDALQLQITILQEQINAQNDKLKELEMNINEKNHQLQTTEDLLNREMLSRSSLETQKLELMQAISEFKLQQATLERENFELRSGVLKSSLTNLNNAQSPYTNKRYGTQNMQQFAAINQKNNNTLSGSHGNLSQNLTLANASSPEFSRQRTDIHYSSLPRQSFATATMLSLSSSGGLNGNHQDTSDISNGQRRNVAFSNNDKIIDDSINIPQRSYQIQALTSPSMSQKHKGLRGIFEKIKSNNNGNVSLVEDSIGNGENDFVRGGMRATAGPRLGWSSQEKNMKPFKDWDTEMICSWLEELGLDYAIENAKRWLKNGSELMSAAPLDIEKELNLKSNLHRKKILLAMADITEQESDDLLRNAGKLDTAWVLRWLDDIGLPQHKDEFMAARVDGRVLHRLTFDDLAYMHITSTLHAASLRRGIQLLREQNFNPDCLIRRLGEIDKNKIVFWTSHCIMEWLRLVDLAEYAPNLRGSGVHGSLMVNEIKFNTELLADLLSIPGSKTLLRRHLQTHFKDLLGRDCIQLKREAENTLGFIPLTITAKIKTPKKSQFSLKRKKSIKNEETEFSNYVCPMTGSASENIQKGNALTTNNLTYLC